MSAPPPEEEKKAGKEKDATKPNATPAKVALIVTFHFALRNFVLP